MQDDVRDERVGVANRPVLQPQKLGIDDGAIVKKFVTESTAHDEDQEEIRRLLLKACPPIDWNPTTFGTITKLNLPECGLSSLPTDLARWLPNLSILFCPKNNFEELPAVIGSCPSLQMVSFKSNGMKRIHPNALQPQLRWLILTDNELEAIPDTIGHCTILQKLMLSGNHLTKLPDEIANCHCLQLVRLASNRLTEPPMSLLQLPNLSWIALSDNPFISDCMNRISNTTNNEIRIIENIVQGEMLGEGASGVTRRGDWNGKAVAVKTYNGAMTSDGNPIQEKALALAASSLSSPCLVKVLGQTRDGSLVMELLENFAALAGPPSMETCSRDTYGKDDVVGRNQAVSMVSGLLEALVKLHEANICHGDFYGHNILVSRDDDVTQVRLSDFGAAFSYDRTADYGIYVEQIEMRAFAHLVDEIARLLADGETEAIKGVRSALTELAKACRQDNFAFSRAQDLWRQKVESLH